MSLPDSIPRRPFSTLPPSWLTANVMLVSAFHDLSGVRAGAAQFKAGVASRQWAGSALRWRMRCKARRLMIT